MSQSDDPRIEPRTAARLKDDIDSGRTTDKVAMFDPAASPLGTDDEAAGTPNSPARVAMAERTEGKPVEVRNPHQRGGWAVYLLIAAAVAVGAVAAAWLFR